MYILVAQVHEPARAFLPEWSKGAGLRSAVHAERVGSNPTECIRSVMEYGLLFIGPKNH